MMVEKDVLSQEEIDALLALLDDSAEGDSEEPESQGDVEQSTRKKTNSSG